MAYVSASAEGATCFSLPAFARAFGRARREEPALVALAASNGGLVLLFLALMPLDGRSILGIDPWVKPLKFALSIAIYCATFALLLLPTRPGGLRAFARWGTGGGLAVEIALITLQSARGTRSHFNDASALDGILFGVMGLAIIVVTLAAFALLALHLRATALPAPVQWGARLGIAVSLAGALLGGAMLANEGHTVGAEDGGEGLFFVNWSRENGDLRIAHFVGLHALQALPLVGLAFARSPRGVPLVFVASASYVAVVCGVFAWALAGRPLP